MNFVYFILQALVDVNDKEQKFVGSRQWIGSMEVSYVLDHLIGVSLPVVYTFVESRQCIGSMDVSYVLDNLRGISLMMD